MSYEYKDELDANNQRKIQDMLADLPISVDRYITSTARTKSTRTTLTYVRMIRAFFLYMQTNHEAFEDISLTDVAGEQLNRITLDDVDSFLAHLKAHQVDRPGRSNKNNTVEVYISALNAYFSFLYKREEIDKNPFQFVERHHEKVRRPYYLVGDENETFYQNILTGDGLSPKMLHTRERFHTAFRDYMICRILGMTGIRVSECVSLDLDDINFKSKSFQVIRKGNKEAEIFFSDRVADELKEYIEDVRPLYQPEEDEKALFLVAQGAHRGKRISVRSVELLVKKYAAASGITYAGEFSAHSLRHSFAMESLKKTGGNLSLTQKLLGHEDISTTTIYAEATEEEIRNARNLF
ncbi:MAG: tyrosine-type recombinase/integrase [Lachnospiraceae bacterium]|nr:tyrosine-type recombinase/integrase [Lachnospiraceae bacterium]